MVDAIISYTVETLGDLLKQEAELLSSARGEVEKLQTELTWLRSFLKDADGKQGDHDTVRTCLEQIREAVYEVEDVLEDFVLKIEKSKSDPDPKGQQKKGLKQRFKDWVSKPPKLHKIGVRVQTIREKINELTTKLQAYGITSRLTDSSSSSSSSKQQKQKEMLRTYSYIDESNVVVGLEEDTRNLVEELVKGQSRVVFISGIGGLGKTTLARKVYQHEEVKREFEAFAWVYVSQQFETRQVWEEVLVSLSSPDYKGRKMISIMNESELTKEICKIQQQKRCLVVLDDMWTGEAWKRLTTGAFPSQNITKGSKIIVTSRIKSVTAAIQGRVFCHEPKLFTEEESWELFKKIMCYAGNESCDCEDFENDSFMKELGQEMVRYCAGLPLAITVLGGLLAKKFSANEWEMVRNNIRAFVLSSESDENDDYGRVLKVLSLSYDYLPYHLKSCFLHLSNFPEDFEIRTRPLITMWIAEGFIHPQMKHGQSAGTMTIEEVAYSCLIELVDRHMVQVGVRDETGRIRSCRMHDLMRETCIEKAKDESFIQIIDGMTDSSSWPTNMMMSNTQRARRLAINLYGDGNELVSLISKRNNLLVRSLLMFPTSTSHPACPGEIYRFATLTQEMLSYIFKNLKLLRCLDFSEILFPTRRLPEEIGDYVHLRFLNFRGSNINEFPSSLGNLVFLQYLNLKVQGTSRKTPHLRPRLPNVIWKLRQLRHLHLPVSIRDGNERLRLDGLSNLQILMNFNTEKCYVEDLFKLTNLRKLKMFWGCLLEFGRICKDTSFTFKHLHTLKVDQGRNNKANVDFRQVLPACPHLVKLSSAILLRGGVPVQEVFSKNCTILKLWHCKFWEDPMPILEKLLNLKLLLVGLDSYMGRALVCSRNGFPQLICLELFQLRNLEEWKLEEGGMRKLEFVDISMCSNLRAIPEGVRSISTLGHMKITQSSSDFKEKHKEGGEYFYRIKHVPTLTIT